jgi:hypothetical protein
MEPVARPKHSSHGPPGSPRWLPVVSERETRLPSTSALRLPEDDARRLLLVRAIEAEDPSGALLTREDRHYATGAALAQPGGDGDGSGGAAFLARRSRFALDRLRPRYPVVEEVERRACWPRWVNLALPLAALALGWTSNEMFDGRRLNIISFPLVAMLAWNLAVYLLLVIGLARRAVARRSEGPPAGLAGLVGRLARTARRGLGVHPTLVRGVGRFTQDWLRYSSGLSRARAAYVMHLSAACLAGGVLLGMYASGWDVEYRAGWESTWIRSPDTLHGLLTAVLGPASTLTGIALPAAAELPALNWGAGRGVNAAPWIHLYAVTALLFIIGPRLLLAAGHALEVAHRRRRVPVPSSDDFYVRTLLRSSEGGGSAVRVIPYSFNPSEATKAALRRLLLDVLGERTRVTIEPSILYGGEDEWLAGAGLDVRDDDYLVALFNLSTTPEAENHGALIAGVRQHLTKARRDAVVAAILDESAMKQRLGGQTGADARLDGRRQAWHAMLRPLGIEPVGVDLGSDDEPALARALERGLLGSGAEDAA